ncbi:MAG: saccharopine dehydrogenase NADP-binding domain-containing protein [Proteobacteria bacterium]|nr:saccharopine dehydrogenase NADP-binding domain-containing protein [Pseudomonadota bacterium]
MRVLVLGGAGNFGARIVRALAGDAGIDVISAGRRGAHVAGAGHVRTMALDIADADFRQRLQDISPNVVISCVGPFQGQGYAVARACIACGIHYVDLADGRAFVTGFARALDAPARDAGVACVTGASTLPALSAAVVDALAQAPAGIEAIETVIAPGQRAPRGEATLAAVFGYLGRRFDVWRESRWQSSWGWMDLRSVEVAQTRRWAAACDVPDLALFPQRYASVSTVTFDAALEFKVQHVALWMLAALRRCGLALPVAGVAISLDRWAPLFDRWAGDLGGMAIAVTVRVPDGRRLRRVWQLVTPARAGPEIPCFAAVLLVKRMARGEVLATGAYPCMGQLTLSDFAPMFAMWGMSTRIDEAPV